VSLSFSCVLVFRLYGGQNCAPLGSRNSSNPGSDDKFTCVGPRRGRKELHVIDLTLVNVIFVLQPGVAMSCRHSPI
jgi:hypothetical protein